MLCSSSIGTVEFRSLLEPVRVSNPCATYIEASVQELDVHKKVATCVPAARQPDGSEGPPFDVHYDTAFLAVGEQPASFGVAGAWLLMSAPFS